MTSATGVLRNVVEGWFAYQGTKVFTRLWHDIIVQLNDDATRFLVADCDFEVDFDALHTDREKFFVLFLSTKAADVSEHFAPFFPDFFSSNCMTCDEKQSLPELKAWEREPCIMGIDEAGRGPVLGAMVYGGAWYFNLEYFPVLQICISCKPPSCSISSTYHTYF